MIIRFMFESVVGLICLVSILFLGAKGTPTLVLFAFLPVIMRLRKISPDERELQLFYKTGNLTMGLIVLAIFLVNYFSGLTVNGHLIGENWMALSITSMLFIHGVAGLFIFKRI